MRLINVLTGCIEEFSFKTPPYAILSHTWDAEEVTFTELSDASPSFSVVLDPREALSIWENRIPEVDFHSEPVCCKKGYKKIRFTCAQAIRDELQYAWVDTCNIDKRSSAELSEAINSEYFQQEARLTAN